MSVYGAVGTGLPTLARMGARPRGVKVPVAAAVATVEVSPATVAGSPDGQASIAAVLRDAGGNTLSDSRSVAWSSSDELVAVVALDPTDSRRATVTFVGVGSCTITATSEGQNDTCGVTVSAAATPPPVAFHNGPYTATVGTAVRFTAAGTFDADHSFTVAWNPGDGSGWTAAFPGSPALAPAGYLYDQVYSSPGTYTVQMRVVDTVDGGTTTVATTCTVDEAGAGPVASVTVTPSSVAGDAGETFVLTIEPRDSAGVLLVGRNISWESSNQSVATLTLLPGQAYQIQLNIIGAGSATITGTCEGFSDTCAVTGAAPPGGDAPNLGAGFSLLGTKQFTGPTEAGWGNVGQFTSASNYKDADGYAPAGVTAPGRAPGNDDTLGVLTYVTGRAGGNSPGMTFLSGLGSGNYTELFLVIYLQLSSNWEGHNSGKNKMLIANIHGNPAFVFHAIGANKGTMRYMSEPQNLGMNNSGGTAGGYTRSLSPNINNAAATVRRGEWQRIEVRIKANTPGVLNGEMEWWVTNYTGGVAGTPQRCGFYNDIGWSNADQPNTWSGPRLEPIWGGTGDTIPETQYLFAGRMLVYGK